MIYNELLNLKVGDDMTEVTTSTDIQPSNETQFNQIKGHNSRSHSYNSNVDIDRSRSNLNSTIKLNTTDDLLSLQYEQEFIDYNTTLVDKYNDGKLSMSNLERREKSIDKTILKGTRRDKTSKTGSSQKQPFSNLVIEVGDVNTYRHVLDLLDVDYSEIESKTDADYTYPKINNDQDAMKVSKFYQDYNERAATKLNDSLAGFGIAESTVHLDESGNPHIHVEAVNMGHDAKGKASPSVYRAVEESLRGFGLKASKTNNRDNLKALREPLDKLSLSAFNETLEAYGIKESFDLYRKDTDEVGLPIETFKSFKTTKHKLKKSVSKQTLNTFLNIQNQTNQDEDIVQDGRNYIYDFITDDDNVDILDKAITSNPKKYNAKSLIRSILANYKSVFGKSALKSHLKIEQEIQSDLQKKQQKRNNNNGLER